LYRNVIEPFNIFQERIYNGISNPLVAYHPDLVVVAPLISSMMVSFTLFLPVFLAWYFFRDLFVIRRSTVEAFQSAWRSLWQFLLCQKCRRHKKK